MLSVLPLQIGFGSEQRTAAHAALCSLVPAAEFHLFTAAGCALRQGDPCFYAKN